MAENAYIGNFHTYFAIFKSLTGTQTLPNNFYSVEEVQSFDLVGHMQKFVKNWPQKCEKSY